MQAKKFERNDALCQYTKLESALKIFNPKTKIDNLPFCLRLSRIINSNDPFDIKGIRLTERSCTWKEDKSTKIRLSKILKITCFSHGYAKSNTAAPTLPLDIRHVYIKPRMWALYGGKNGDNSGVCIVFDAEKIQKRFVALEKDFNIRFNKVRYKNLLDTDVVEKCISRNKIDFNKTPESQN